MSICNYCFWNDLIHDEYGAIDYCVRLKIYSEDMENIKECDFFQRRTSPFTIKVNENNKYIREE